MIEAVAAIAADIIGTDERALTVWNVLARAVIVYIAAVALVRLGEKRFIGKFAAFDVILGFMIGSILARAITGSSGFLPTMAGAAMLVLMHSTFAVLAYYFEWFASYIKGDGRLLIDNGRINWSAMRRSHISRQDLMGALRENSGIEDIAQVKAARLERSGNVSVIRYDS